MSTADPDRRRPYTQKIRAERHAQTRLRITEAALSLHQEVGPAHTTISAVAKRAGVERPTVYRHFPDEASLLGACRDHWLSQNPPPDPTPWLAIDDAEERLRTALTDIYGFHRASAPMTGNLLRDASISPVVADAITAMRAGFAAIVDLLVVPWDVAPERVSRLRAALAHGVSFETWRSLCVTNGLDEADAVELAIGMIRSAAG